MRKLEECKNMFKELYMNVLDGGGFDVINEWTNRDITRYNMFVDTLSYVYGEEFSALKLLWIKEATEEYYNCIGNGGLNMTRVEQNIVECWDDENKDFDWDEYQYLCDCADYWDCEE